MGSEARIGLTWRWSYALRGIVTGAPAAAAAFSDVRLAAALAVGLLPVCSIPLAPRRSGRIRTGRYGVLAAGSIFLGGVLAQWPVLAVIGIVLAGGLLGHAVAARGRPLTMLGLVLCLPLLAVGFSYPGTETGGEFAVDILLGTAWSVLVALAWPTHPPPPPQAAPMPPASLIVPYGWLAGLVGGACAAVGFAADLEHVGWAPAAALLVMRPNPPAQRMRSLHRVADVVLGAAAAILLVRLDPPAWVYAGVVLAVVVGATATAGSRWYVLPTFTTYLVFLMLLAGHPADAGSRFWERVVETALGIGVAAAASLVVLPVLERRSRPRVTADRPGAG